MGAINLLASYLQSRKPKTSAAQLARKKETARLAERRRVDEAMKPARTRQTRKKKKVEPKVYPRGVKMMGQGWRNLYDTLGKKKEE